MKREHKIIVEELRREYRSNGRVITESMKQRNPFKGRYRGELLRRELNRVNIK